MAFNVLLVHQDKAGTLLQEHVDAQLVKTGTEFHVLAVMEEDNGTLLQNNVFALLEIGTASHVFFVQLVKHGILQPFHVHAQHQHIGMVLIVEHVQVQADIGIINLMIVSAEPEIGTEQLALFVQPIQIGTEKLVFLVMETESGTH
jgi:hypothetical protein